MFSNSKLCCSKWNKYALQCTDCDLLVLQYCVAIDAVRIAGFFAHGPHFVQIMCPVAMFSNLNLCSTFVVNLPFVHPWVQYKCSCITIVLHIMGIRWMWSVPWNAPCRKRARGRALELDKMQLRWMWPALCVHDEQIGSSNTALYYGKIGLKYWLGEWYILSIIPKRSQQILIGRWGMRCPTPLFHYSSNNGVHRNLFVRRAYRRMHFVLFLNIERKLKS